MFGETEYQYVSNRCENCHLDFGCIERLTVSRPMRILFSQLSGCLSTCDGGATEGGTRKPAFSLLCWLDLADMSHQFIFKTIFCKPLVTYFVQGVIELKITKKHLQIPPKKLDLSHGWNLWGTRVNSWNVWSPSRPGNGIDGILGCPTEYQWFPVTSRACIFLVGIRTKNWRV